MLRLALFHDYSMFVFYSLPRCFWWTKLSLKNMVEYVGKANKIIYRFRQAPPFFFTFFAWPSENKRSRASDRDKKKEHEKQGPRMGRCALLVEPHPQLLGYKAFKSRMNYSHVYF